MSKLSIVAGILLITLSSIIKCLQIRNNGMKASIRNLIALPSTRGQNGRQLIISFIAQCVGLLWLVMGIVIGNLPNNMLSTWSEEVLDLLSFYMPLVIGIILFRVFKDG